MTVLISSLWTQGLNEKEAASFKDILLNSKIFTTRLSAILDEQIRALDNEELSSEHFNKPGWAEREAFFLGQKKKLRELKSLFDFKNIKD